MPFGLGRHRRPAQAQQAAERTAAAQAAQVACQAELAQVKCELQLQRLQREDREDAEAKKRQQKEERRETRRARRKALWEERRKRRERPGSPAGPVFAAATLGIPPVLGLLIYAFLSGGDVEALAIGLLAAAAAFALGALLGFLFGIPRSVGSGEAGRANDGDKAAADAAIARHFTANTNLEQISDWLTKILVGVGLVQIHEVSGAVGDLADGLAPGLGPRGFAIAVALLVTYAITGFIVAYLFTRLRLQGAFEGASVVSLVLDRARKETSAIALVQQQLTPGVDKPTVDELRKALKAATPGVREQAFFLARRQSLENWAGEGSDEERRELAGLSAPIFEALIACDSERRYHRPRAELGYVLLQMEPPKFGAAKAAFDEAIALRPASLITRTPRYELNRAFCTIELDADFRAERASSPALVKAVYADLDGAVDQLDNVDETKYDEVAKWLELNSGQDDDLQQRVGALLERFRRITPT